VKIYDLSSCPLSYKNGAYGGTSGRKNGIVWCGELWLIKYPKNLSGMHGNGIASFSTAPLSEYIGSHIYGILGYDVHQTELGIRNNKLVVACKDFAVDDTLLEIRTLKNSVDKSFLQPLSGYQSIGQTHVVDLPELFLHLQNNPILTSVPGMEERFFEQSLIDIFINNNDRNNGNWGILRSFNYPNTPDRIAPVFGNGGAFLPKADDDEIKRLLCASDFDNNATNVDTAYGEHGKVYNAKNFLCIMRRQPLMINALKKVVPLIHKKMPEICRMIDGLPSYCRLANGEIEDICTDERKQLYKLQMQVRYEQLLFPEYELAKEM
jgi:hypothetical protein